MILDLNDPVTLLRLRCGDTRDIPILADEVYQSALREKNGNMKAATMLCANYILAQLAHRSTQTLGVITVYGSQMFDQYKQYVMMITKDPSFSNISPIPYSGPGGESPIVKFTRDWDKGCDCSIYRL